MARKKKSIDAIDPAEYHRIGTDLPFVEPKAAESKAEDKVYEALSKLNEDATAEFPSVSQFQQARNTRAKDAVKILLTRVKNQIDEALYEFPECGSITFDCENAPLDVRYITAASLQKAGFAVDFNGDRLIHINLPSVSALTTSGQVEQQVSSVTPL